MRPGIARTSARPTRSSRRRELSSREHLRPRLRGHGQQRAVRVRHPHADGRIAHINLTLLAWSGHAADQMVGKRFSNLLTMPGRIYYETHIAPPLRMQGFFNEFAIDLVTAAGEPLPTARMR